MKKLLILSGKGGTGKTTTAAAFIKFSNAKAMADCDVDAPNLHIVADMDKKAEYSDFYGADKAVIDKNKCIGCGKCFQNCKFDAIIKSEGKCRIDEYACEGCGVCEYVCPQKAVTMVPDIAGKMELYKGEKVFSTATLKMGRGNSGKLVSKVKNTMTVNAFPDTELAVIDGSPGIGCPVIASISGVDLILIVAEPSLSGLSDMKRIIKTAEIFQTPIAVCVNKYDTSKENTDKIKEFCKENGISFVGKIPYDKQASIAINDGKCLADYDCKARDALYKTYQNTMEILNIK